MESVQKFTVRPSPKPARSDFKHYCQVILPSSALLLHELHAGDACQVKTAEGILGPVTVWPSSEKIQDSVIQIPKSLQLLYGMKLGDKVCLVKHDVAVENARIVTLVEVPQSGLKSPLPFLDEPCRLHWAWILEYVLEKAETLCPGILLDGIEVRGEKRCFKIIDINSSTSLVLYHSQPDLKVSILDVDSTPQPSKSYSSKSLILTGEDIGGLDRQLNQLNSIFTAYADERLMFKFPSYYRPIRGGIILYGPSGTGKTKILKKALKGGWRKVYEISTVTSHQRNNNRNADIRDMFSEAHRHQPCLIVIDGVERIAGKLEASNSEFVYSAAPVLCEQLDLLGSARVLVLAATTDLSQIDENLRRPGRLEYEVEMPVPNSKARAQILKITSGLTKDTIHDILERLAERTHGFVGADLDRLVQVAVDKATARIVAEYLDESLEVANVAFQPKSEIKVEVSATDLDKALIEVRPTAMREIFLETPKVRWSDVGGQHKIKHFLEQAVRWPFEYSIDMDRLGIEPKKGLLLYGPPGCSKTLTAQAVATESDLNFIAVKGGEFLRMYVGESERALRDVFRKARAASPSILFFDEIDAIGASREGKAHGGEMNVLTTMLNELDGIEPLKGVFVLAATNKPHILDPALMRPGRLDTMLYVGPPNFESRQEILQIKLRSMDVEDDVDITDLANWTDGYSGAELVSVCQRAGYAALEEQVSSGVKQQVGKRHFDIAVLEVPRQITPDMVKRYKVFEAKTL